MNVILESKIVIVIFLDCNRYYLIIKLTLFRQKKKKEVLFIIIDYCTVQKIFNLLNCNRGYKHYVSGKQINNMLSITIQSE